MTFKVNAIANGFAILKYLSIQKFPLGVTKIARATGISPSSCFNILKTLVALDLATFDEQTKGYGMGFAVVDLAQNVIANNPLIKIAEPHLLELAERFNGFAGLWEISSDSATLIATEEKRTRIRFTMGIGYTQGIGTGSVGRAVLSQYSNDRARLEAAFNEVSWEGDITLQEYVKDIQRAAKRGYAIDCNKLFLGGTSVSALMTKEFGGKQYCLSFVAISRRYKSKEVDEIGRFLLLTAERLVAGRA